MDDVLRTSSKSRRGLINVSVCMSVSTTTTQRQTILIQSVLSQVQSMTERVIVFLLSQVVDRSSQERPLFSLHPRTESCKLLWSDGRAVGFYTVKHRGGLCDGWSGRCYLLPVLDTVLVRSSCRRRGFGLRMLEDFCSSFSREKFLGVSSPLSPSMAAGQQTSSSGPPCRLYK